MCEEVGGQLQELTPIQSGACGTQGVLPSLGGRTGWVRVGVPELMFTVRKLFDLQQISYLISQRLGFFVSRE